MNLEIKKPSKLKIYLESLYIIIKNKNSVVNCLTKRLKDKNLEIDKLNKIIYDKNNEIYCQNDLIGVLERKIEELKNDIIDKRNKIGELLDGK